MARNVFLSFVEEDISSANFFRGQAKNPRNPLEFSDYSVKEAFNSAKADYIKSGITKLIKRASVTICLIGRSTYKSKWVDWEINKSGELQKGILGVRLHSDVLSKLLTTIPSALKSVSAPILDWNAELIVEAIEKAAKQAGY